MELWVCQVFFLKTRFLNHGSYYQRCPVLHAAVKNITSPFPGGGGGGGEGGTSCLCLDAGQEREDRGAPMPGDDLCPADTRHNRSWALQV